MPARLDLTPEQYRERQRAQARERKRKQRSRDALRDGHVTAPAQGSAGHVTPPVPPVSSLSTEKEIEKVGQLLAPLAGKGYEHDPAFWAEMAAAYPAARLAVEAYKMASWFKAPAQKKRTVKSWPAFIDNWLKKARGDGAAPTARAVRLPDGPYAPPAAFQRNPGPPGPALLTAPLQRIAPGELQRALAERARVPLNEKLRAIRGTG